jgi:uncharacterized membrane protein
VTGVSLDQLFTTLDTVALAYFLLSIAIYRLLVGSKLSQARGLVGAIQRQRVAWMANMARRGEHRTMDIILLNNLVQGNAFFASTTAFAVGGIAAVLGSGDKAQSAIERLPYAAQANPILWEIKLAVIMAVFIFAFFKFAWAFRLGHYTTIMIGATPMAEPGNAQSLQACEIHAEHTARLVGLSGEHANSGLRSFYYAIAVLAWFYHPLAFIAATTWVLAILLRRDFFSRSLRLITELAARNGHGKP